LSLTFEEKRKRHLERRLAPDREVTAGELGALGVTGIHRYMSTVLFEEAAALSSPVIGRFREVFIGTHSYMNEGGYLRDHVVIGRYCSIGRRVTIGAGGHAMRGVSTSPFLVGTAGAAYTPAQVEELGLSGKRRHSGPAILEHDVWVGDGAVIMPGITVATGTVIGANAVVTRDVAPYTIMGGIPAKPIGSRFPAGMVDRLLASRYWEIPALRLKAMPTRNVFEFLATVADEPPDAVLPTLAMAATAASR
jgi:virginiamycin A acetyltransferase